MISLNDPLVVNYILRIFFFLLFLVLLFQTFPRIFLTYVNIKFILNDVRNRL